MYRPSSGNAYILDCYFHDMKYEGERGGGAIDFAFENSRLLIESCTFDSCCAKHDAGAIRAENTDCVMNRICGYKCKATQLRCSFCCNIENNCDKNYALDCSISNCEAKSQYTMFHQYGHIIIKSVNLSSNTCNACSAIQCLPNKVIPNEEDLGTVISYSSFAHNIAKSNNCIVLSYSDAQANHYKINNTNIIYNKQEIPNGNGLIYTNGNTKIENTCIMKNSGDPIFQTYDENSKFIFMI